MARATIKDKKDVLSNCEPNNVRTSRIKIDPQKEGYGVLKLKVIEQDFDVFALTYQGKAEYQSERNASYVKCKSTGHFKRESSCFYFISVWAEGDIGIPKRKSIWN